MIYDREFDIKIPETEEESDQLMREYYREQYRHEYWTGLFTAFRQWAKYDEEWSLNFIGRVFYTVKAVICMLIHREADYWAKDCVLVSMFDDQHIGNGGGTDVPSWYASWTEMVVGHGILKNWSYGIYSNANA